MITIRGPERLEHGHPDLLYTLEYDGNTVEMMISDAEAVVDRRRTS